MPSILFIYRFVLLAFMCFGAISCSVTSPNSMNAVTDSLKNAPKGSYIKPYIKTLNSENTDYKIFLNKNLGETRTKTEAATLTVPINFRKISFELYSDDSLTVLKTPLKLIDILDNSDNSLMSLHLHHKIYWIQSGNTRQKIPLFLDINPQKFIIKNYGKYLLVRVNTTDYKVPINNSLNTLIVGIIRSDLLRYRGHVVPEQYLYINNIQIQ